MIAVNVKYTSSLLEFERRLALPLVKIASHLLRVMSRRVQGGQGATGPMRPLGADTDPGSIVRFWLPPGKAASAPDGNKIKSGPLAGWAVWRNYAAFLRETGRKAPRDLEETGAFWRSVAVRVTGPNRVKIAPYGRHAGPSGERISNTAVGFLASRGEPKPLLHPTREEIVEAGRIVFAEVDGQAIEAARVAGLGYQVRQRANSTIRRASRLLGD